MTANLEDISIESTLSLTITGNGTSSRGPFAGNSATDMARRLVVYRQSRPLSVSHFFDLACYFSPRPLTIRLGLFRAFAAGGGTLSLTGTDIQVNQAVGRYACGFFNTDTGCCPPCFVPFWDSQLYAPIVEERH